MRLLAFPLEGPGDTSVLVEVDDMGGRGLQRLARGSHGLIRAGRAFEAALGDMTARAQAVARWLRGRLHKLELLMPAAKDEPQHSPQIAQEENRGQQSDLSPMQRQILNHLVEQFLKSPNLSVQGTSVRLVPIGSRQERAAALRSLAPQFASMHGNEPDHDFWAPTLEGLLASSSEPFATQWIEHTLELCRVKARTEGAFLRYTW